MSIAAALQERRVADRDRASLDLPGDAPARRARRSPTPSRARACARSPRATIAAASGCSLRPLEARGEPQQLVLGEARRGTTATTRGLPSVSVPVLSTTSVSTFSNRSSASAFLISTPACAPAPDADHDRHRRREAKRARAGDDQHRDGRDEPVGEARLRPQDRPGHEGERPRSRSPAARTSRTPGRPGAGSARGCAAPRRPSARSAPASCRGRPCRRA